MANCYWVITNVVLPELWETGIKGGELCLQAARKGFHKENPPETERVRKGNHASNKSMGGLGARDRKQACLGRMHFPG